MKLVKEVLEEFLNNGSWTRKQPREQAHIPQVSSATSSFWQHLGFTSTAEQRNSTKIYRLKPLLDFELPISLQLMDISLQARAMQKSLWPLCTGTEAAAEQCDCHQDPFSGTTDTQHWCHRGINTSTLYIELSALILPEKAGTSIFSSHWSVMAQVIFIKHADRSIKAPCN